MCIPSASVAYKSAFTPALTATSTLELNTQVITRLNITLNHTTVDITVADIMVVDITVVDIIEIIKVDQKVKTALSICSVL